MQNKIVLSIQNISKNFKQGDDFISVLSDISINLYEAETLSLIGTSGSGKTTLLHIAGLLENKDCGLISCMGKIVPDNESKRTRIRREYFGFVYQFHHLIEEFNALENVMIAQKIKGKTDEKYAKETLERLGLSSRMKHFPSQLSGGEQQRVAISRALVNRPKIILADEPTGNLDNDTSESVFSDLIKFVKEDKASAFIVTHNTELAMKMDRVIKLNHREIEVIK